MKVTFRLGSDLAPDQYARAARAAREGGLERVWLADNPLERSAPISAAAMCAAEPTLGIGMGVVSARERNPVVLTQEMVALQGLTTGQVIVGLGIGADDHRRRLGLPKASGLRLLRETTEVVRALTAGESVTPPGGDPDAPVALKVVNRPLPVQIGAIGPKTLALAGEIADGVVLSMGSTPAASRRAAETARSARAAAGRDGGDFEMVGYVAFGGLGEDAATGLQGFARHFLGLIASQPVLEPLLEGTGVDAAQAGRIAGAEEAVPAELVEAMSIAGPLDLCLAQLRAYEEAGIDEVALGLGGWIKDFDAAVQDAVRLSAAFAEPALAA